MILDGFYEAFIVVFIDSETDMLLGFGELTDIREIPFSEYLQFYGVRRHRWEAVPFTDGEQRAYAYVFRNSYPVSNPRKVSFEGKDRFVVKIRDRELSGVKRQSSLFDY